MNLIDHINICKNENLSLKRGLMDPEVERKIKTNVFEIAERLVTHQGEEAAIKTFNLMLEDWKKALKADWHFGREEDAQKELTKIVLLEQILSRRSHEI